MIARVSRPLIAFVFCLFLFSDYLLYAQWHVVTYRVWYGLLFFGVLFAVTLFRAWFARWITEIAVTDRRIIYKRGFIWRHTEEMNMDKVPSVDVDQSILGRMLDYGTIHVIGTGGGQSVDGSARGR